MGNSSEAAKYAAVIFDYEYLKSQNQDIFEERIQSNNVRDKMSFIYLIS